MRPEERAVLSDPLTLVLPAPLPGGGLQASAREARGAIGPSIEVGKVPTDDLLGAVAFMRWAPAFQLARWPSASSM